MIAGLPVAPQPNRPFHSGVALLVSTSAAVALFECLYYIVNARFDLLALLAIAAATISSGFVLAIAFCVLAEILGYLEARAPLRGRIAASVALVTLAPQATVSFTLLETPGKTGWASLGILILLLAALIALRSRLSGGFWPALAAAVPAALLSLAVLASDYSLARVDPERFDLYFLYVHALSISTVGLAAALHRSLAYAGGREPSPAIAASLGIVGAAAVYLLFPRLAISNDLLRGYALLLGFALLACGGPLFADRRRWKRALLAGLLGVAALAGATGLSSRLPFLSWSLSEDTVFTSALFESTGIFRRLAQKREALFRSQPGYREGLATLETARRWNAERGPGTRSDLSFLLITVDSWRFDSLVSNNPSANVDWAPRLNRFAESCVRFRRAYAQGGWTSISLPSVIWSKYPRMIAFVPLYEDKRKKLHFENDLPPDLPIVKRFQSPVNETDPNLASAFNDAGFLTVAVLNDGVTDYFSPGLGFSRNFQELFYAKAERRKRPSLLRPGGSLDEIVSASVMEKLDGPSDRPFFVWAHFFSPHNTVGKLPPEYEAVKMPHYYRKLRLVDTLIGRILDRLESSGKIGTTVVAIAGDHGESFGERRANGHGLNLYDEQARTPLLIWVPGVPGRSIDAPAGLIDVAPTLLDFAGLRIPGTFAGVSLRGLMTGAKKEHPPVYLETWQNEPRSIEQRQHLTGALLGYDKIMFDEKRQSYSFYDLERDPKEKVNLVEKMDRGTEDRFLRLGGLLAGWRAIPIARRPR